MTESREGWTPGPWNILGDDESIGGVPFIEVMGGEIATPTYRDVTHVCADLGDDDEFRLTDEDWANAHLIAAAPDLYEALAGLVGQAESFKGAAFGKRIEAALAALARARNEGGE